ncbi:CHAD domain-containing protein [Streptomyces olivoverticillatus]|uniref:CHAD domain-containing protein n=1 Tax=Streptomyces olivoverticillatus TaxID=66427 RepID=A0A7W7LLG9_9ACTN|nr:CYTH and CHAD domain-containing protein [Streptomyces olivoverticillatus]MBB4892464.1 CHAD domain-containing protein [Streptomyces olivoverticillatus]
MADTVREIERKYEGGDGTGQVRLPDLSGAAPVATAVDRGTVELDAVYYDTTDRRLHAAGITLRRRTGGSDAGWHLKLPVAPGVRDEIRTPLSTRVPGTLTALVRARTRGAPLTPLVRIRSRRDVCHLLDEDGTLLAEASTDAVTATPMRGHGAPAEWTEVEVELAPGTDPGLLDALEPHLREAGLRPSEAPSKLARALRATGIEELTAPTPPDAEPDTAGDHVLAYLREQAEALATLDPGARLGQDDAVHQMRVATRRIRAALRTYGKVLDRRATAPVTDELQWLATELGVARDREVLAERLCTRLGEVPRSLVRGPVRARLRRWSAGRNNGTRKHITAVLDSKRHLALLDALDTLLAEPPLRPAAARQPDAVLAKAVLREYDRLVTRVEHALAADPGTRRDAALHDARKAAKRVRYAAEAATPALGKEAKRFAGQMKAVQTLLGDHQDSVMARTTLREMAAAADDAGEPTFTYGLLYGREEQCADRTERELPGVWEKASDKRWRQGLEP